MDTESAQYLTGVHALACDVSIGPDNAFPQQRMKRSMTKGNFRAVVACPAKGCHGGGFELGRALYEHAVARQQPTARAALRCRGYRDLGRGRRQSCDYSLWFAASIVYGARHY